MKTIGVVCDDYKIDTFKKNLSKLGYDEIEVTRSGPKVSLLKFQIKEEDVEKVVRKIAQINSNASRSN